MAILRKGAFSGLMKDLPDYHLLPGLPLRTEVKVPQSGTIKSTIESVSLTPLPDSDFHPWRSSAKCGRNRDAGDDFAIESAG